jgi:hypothetical protein
MMGAAVTFYKVKFAYYCSRCTLTFPYINTHRIFLLFIYLFIYLWFISLLFTFSHNNISEKRMQKLYKLRGIQVQVKTKDTYSESKNGSFILNIVN